MANITATKTEYMTSPGGGNWWVKILFEETGIQDNSSNLTITGTLGASSGNFASESGNTLKIYWHDNNNNIDVLLGSIEPSSAGTNYGQKSVSANYVAEHKANGTLSGYAKAVWKKVSSNQWVPSSKTAQTDDTELTPITQQGSLRIGVNGSWVKAQPYIGINNTWVKAQAYIGVNGNWVKGE